MNLNALVKVTTVLFSEAREFLSTQAAALVFLFSAVFIMLADKQSGLE